MIMQTVTVLLAAFGASSAAAAGGRHLTRRAQEETAPPISTSALDSSPVYCSSIPCPGGYIPVPNAGGTECTKGVCTVAQCCDAFCWGFACTHGIPNWDNINEKCPDDVGCTPDLCCTIPVLMCNSIECPNGFIPIKDAAITPCDEGECTVEQCCDSFCWSVACPGPSIPNPETVNDLCPESGCTTDLCCASFCWGHACPNGFIQNPATIDDQCPVAGCTDDLCCISG